MQTTVIAAIEGLDFPLGSILLIPVRIFINLWSDIRFNRMLCYSFKSAHLSKPRVLSALRSLRTCKERSGLSTIGLRR